VERLADPALDWLATHGLRIAIVLTLAVVITRVAALGVLRFERHIRHDRGPEVEERTRRAQTLVRIAQKTFSGVIVLIAGLMILREMGIDITPVLTGAGVVGLVVGLGAQTLVKDLIAGFFLILEDQVRIGDVAVVNGQGGTVEAINLRTIVLRDMEGTVHVFPNGSVLTLANRTKDFAFYVLDVGARLDQPPDRIAALLREAAGELAADPAWREAILEPLEVLGVDAFVPGGFTMRARLKVMPPRQWEVGRELRRRVALRLVEAGVVPAPTMVEARMEGLDAVVKSASARPPDGA